MYKSMEYDSNKSSPNNINHKNRDIFAFAGIWKEYTTNEKDNLNNFAILTRESNSFMEKIHNRMPLILTQNYFTEYTQVSALIVFLGHLFPIWLKFKGGKGVAKYLGILFGLSYGLSILFIATWVILILTYSTIYNQYIESNYICIKYIEIL